MPNKSFNAIFGDKKFSDIDQKIDDLVEKLPQSNNLGNSSNNSDASTSSVINGILNISDSPSDETQDEISAIFQNISIPRERQARYNLYDEIVKSIPLISRIIKVYSSNVVQKNPTTGQSIIFQQKKNSSETEEQKGKEVEHFVKTFFETFQISKKLRNSVLPKQLKYGDCFIELTGVDEEEVDYNKQNEYALLTEVNNLEKELDRQKSGSLQEFESSIYKLADIITDVSVNDGKSDSSKDDTDFSDIVLKVHNPHNIIILETNYGSCLGYLEVSQESSSSSFQFSQSLSGVVGKVNQLSMNKTQSQDQVTNRLVYYVLRKVLDRAKKSGGNNTDLNNKDINEYLKSLDPKVYNILKRMFIEQGFNQKKGKGAFSGGKMKTRFIPKNRMVSFNNPNVSDYNPYSQSIIEDLILPGKLYMLNQLSNAVMKLSRSSLIRKWTVDIGSQRMSNQNLQKLKREIYNSKITINDLGSFKSVPKLLSDYKDMFVFSQDGQTPVDLDVQSHGDSNVKVEDLEDARKELIALSGVPAPYLGLHDTVELREQLVHSNISFATEIINIQENIIESLNELTDIVADIKKLDNKPSDYVKVSLIPPVTLILQVIESTLSSVGSIAGVFSNLGLKYDPYYFLKYYVPHIDWDEFKERARQYETEKKTREELGGEQEEGGGGYF
ncbi:MAG: portal protein [bacterium]